MLDISPVSEALLPQVPAYEFKKKKKMDEITASRLIRAKVALLWSHVREDSCCPKEQNRKTLADTRHWRKCSLFFVKPEGFEDARWEYLQVLQMLTVLTKQEITL